MPLTGPSLAELGDAVPPRVRLSLTTPYQPVLPHVRGLLAGAAEVDITPPPGMPKAGHSSNAHTGTGFRTRLRAHVVHLRGGTTSIALVQCDLLAGSAIVQRLVADAVADTDVRLDGLFMGATHTHAGPGQFHGNDLMNRFSSNRRGFDPAWTAWLVERIASAVRAAVETRRPARLAFGATDVWGLTRNRSLAAHLRNAGMRPGDTGPQRKYEAVNPRLHLLRVDAAAPEGATEPLAAAVVFSVHGTGISSHDRSYNADVWAYLKGELATHVERSTGTRPVVGAMEGTHGDVAPAVRPRVLAYPEAERVGRGIGAAAAELYDRLEGELSGDVELAAGLREVDLGTRPTVAGITLPPPAFGAATMAGAFENTTPVLHLVPPFRPGVPKPARWSGGPHGGKWIPGGRLLHDRVARPEAFPRVLPVHVLRIGSTAVLGLPFEVTVESGRRVAAAALAAAAGAGVHEIAVSSLANEQFCYLTTPEEYALQRYEGGNTLYGPNSEPFVTALSAQAVRDTLTAGGLQDYLVDRTFDFAARRYLARPTGRRVLRVPGPVSFTDPTATEDGYWQFEWLDAAPGDLAWHEPLARVEARTADGGWRPATGALGPVDDQGWALGVSHLGPGPNGAHRYAARWYTPYLGPSGRFRLAVADARGEWAPASAPLR